MTHVTDTFIDDMVQAIVDEVDPEQVILFGSRGKGDEREHSDVDLVVVEADPSARSEVATKRWSDSTTPWRAFRSQPTSLSIHAMTSITGATPSITCWRGRCGRARRSMSDVKCARMLFRAAEREIAALKFMRHSEEIPDEVFGFHVQQATEKSLKAHLAVLGQEYTLTHDLEALLDVFAEDGIATESFVIRRARGQPFQLQLSPNLTVVAYGDSPN